MTTKKELEEEKAKTLREKAQLMLPTGYVHAGEPELCVRLADAEEEISYYKKMANKYTKETYLLKEEIAKLKEDMNKAIVSRDKLLNQLGKKNNDLEEKLGQIRELFFDIFGEPYLDVDVMVGCRKVDKKKLVGLLGQNSEPKKEEKVE